MNFFLKHAYDIGYGFASLVWPFMKNRQKVAIDNVLACGITDDPKV